MSQEQCHICKNEVDTRHVCRFVPEGERYTTVCLLVCNDCLQKAWEAYWDDPQYRRIANQGTA